VRRIPTILATTLLVIPLINACSNSPEDPVARGLATITSQHLLADVATLAGPEFSGRLPGDVGYEKAAAWAAARFQELGLEPGGDEDGYQQHLPIEYNAIQGTPTLQVTSPDGRTVPARLGPDFVCRGFSGSGTVDAEVVFAGYGLSVPERGYDDYAEIDVADKVVLVFKPNPGWCPDTLGWDWASSTPRAKATTARDHGARAILWVSPPRGGDMANLRGPIGSVLHGPAAHLADMPHLEISLALADKMLGDSGETLRLQALIDSLETPSSMMTGSRAALDVQAIYEPERETSNVVAVLRGSDPELTEEALVIGAHLDHVGRQSPEFYFPGANDNASGSAAVLRLAEAFSRAGRAPRRSVVFVLFAGEESGLIGARFHAENPVFPAEHSTAMFNFDCVACGDSIRVGGGRDYPELWNLAREFDSQQHAMMVEQTWGGGGADATPFHEAGLRTLYWVTTNGYANLHAPGDTPETLNGSLYEQLVKVAFQTAWTVADAPQDTVLAQR